MSEAFFMARDLAPDHPDVVSCRRFRSANQWPENLPGFREPLVEYCDALERLVQRLVRVYARALDLPATYFDGPFIDFQYKLRATHYPSQPKAPDDEFGIAPHTDTSFLTLLAPNDVPGLAFRTQAGDWKIRIAASANVWRAGAGKIRRTLAQRADRPCRRGALWRRSVIPADPYRRGRLPRRSMA